MIAFLVGDARSQEPLGKEEDRKVADDNERGLVKAEAETEA